MASMLTLMILTFGEIVLGLRLHMKILFEKIIHKQLEVYDKYAEFYEVCPEPNILLLSGGKALNDIIRSF